jgi:hypothetical protein
MARMRGSLEAKSGSLAGLHWSTSVVGYQLEGAPDLNGAGQFAPAPQPPTVVNGRFTVTNSLANGREFFRLKWP